MSVNNNSIPGIEVKKPSTNPTIDSEYSDFEIPFYKDEEFFSNIENYVYFVKGVERIVRCSRYYKKYISEIKSRGLDFCAVKSNIREESEDDNLIEMHHYPLTLFDYAAIITDHMLQEGQKVTTFRVADRLIDEHFNHRVKFIMLCETVHEEEHADELFLNMKGTCGDLEKFLKKYNRGVQEEHIKKLNQYIELSQKHDSFDNGVLEVNEFVTKWKRYNN